MKLCISGDGTEDISCRMDSSNWTPSNDVSGVFTRNDVDNFMYQLRQHFVGYLVFPSLFLKNPNFKLQIGSVPPILDPIVCGELSYDTEFKVSNTQCF